MQRKFALLTVLGALIALALPASSMAFMWPASTQFEIAGGSNPPKLGTSLGTCSVSKITGSIPASPANEIEEFFKINSFELGTCTSGTTLEIKLNNTLLHMPRAYSANIFGVVMTLRYSSLPGCKLTGQPPLFGIWSNGALTPKSTKSAYHAQGSGSMVWSNDGAATCALAGQYEGPFWSQDTGGKYPQPWFSTVNNLTNSFPIIFGL